MMDDLPTYVLERDFAAPQTLVWQAWTDPALFSRWYGPGAETRVVACDLRPGGQALVEMRWGGNAQFQRFDYTIVAAPSRLAFVQVTADATWTKAPVAHQPDWPQQLMTDVTLSSNGPTTHMRMTWAPHDCSAAEVAMFRSAMAGLGRGWGAGMQLLDQMLAELQG
jgi:uncharacterized protein YndB with AHSA1/START domain